MVLDIQAIQYIYGANNKYKNGDDIYSFDAINPFLKTIWDSGGNDTITASNFNTKCIIDLRPGHYSTISVLSDPTSGIPWTKGPPTPTYDYNPNLGIAYNCIIENAVGGSGDDEIFGNQANNLIDGGDGIDNAVFQSTFRSAKITRKSDGTIIISSFIDGTDTLTGIEYFDFIDKSVSIINIAPTLAIISAGGAIKQTSQTLSGTVDASNASRTITIYDGASSLGTVIANAGGSWSKTVTIVAAQGVHSITAQAIDAFGNLGISNAIVFNLDSVAPTLVITSTGGSTNTSIQTISGTVGNADSGLTISIYDGTTLLGTTTANSSGAWSKVVTLLSIQGNQFITAKATDAAGNVGTSNAVIYVLNTPSTYSLSASASSVNEGSFATFTLSTTNVSAGTVVPFTISGTVNGSDIVGGVMSGNVTVNANGQATISIPIATDNLTEGPETLTVTAGGSSASVTVNDTSTGNNSSNIITGLPDNTPIMGTAGNDVITANTGTKTIDGGAGTNTVVFEGTQSQYRIGVGSNGTVVVKGPNVSDTLTNIQQLQFGSGPVITPNAAKTDDLLKSCYYDSNNNLITSYVLPNLNTDPNVSVKYAQIADQSLIQTNVLDANGCSNSFFLKGGPATDAISGGTGNDVIDGGTGSNFLTGSGGWDTFFIDGRSGQFTWGTITDYTLAAMGTQNESVSIWGWKPGVSRKEWEANNGAAGYQGATLKLDFDNNGTFDAYVTFTGLAQSQLPTPIEFTPAQTSGNGLLWFK